MAFPSVNVSVLDMVDGCYAVNAAQPTETPLFINGSVWHASGSGSQAVGLNPVPVTLSGLHE